MNIEHCLILLFSYPLVILLIADRAMVWPTRRGNKVSLVLTAEQQTRMEVVGRKLILFRLVILFVVLWATNRSLVGDLSRSASMHIPSAAITGLTIGLALLLASRFLSPINGNFMGGSIGLWMAVFIVGAVVEEIWRAICVVDFQEIGWGAPATAVVTAVAFAVAHLAGRPSRILPGGFLFEAIVGFGLAVSFIRTESLAAPIVASLLYFPMSFLFARKTLAKFTETQ
jgi:Type II CAAX prenyl endopeptidase Rce1-like